MSDKAIFIGGGGEGYALPQELLLGYANRHGLIAGATGTGKTVTLQIMAEGFSAAGVPVFLADVKGDLSGIGLPGSASHKLHDAFARRAQTIGWDLEYRDFPVTFWDIWGRSGHPIRATVAEMGPLLISRMLDLTEAQEGVLNIAFRIADEEGLPLLDFMDLTAILSFVSENARTISTTWGLVSPSSVGAVQRRLLVLENQGGANLFGEPALQLSDLMLCDAQGRGRINMLNAERLMNSPRLYATFLLWLLSQLFEDLPEVGNPDKPKLVFFFDEAHLLFNGAPRALVEKVEQVARLIRSKGVGVYFITQNPADIPETVLGQLGNRVQHALRAFTGKDMRELKRAALNYRPNPRFSTEDALKDVGTGEALTSFLEEKGIPQMVERSLIRPPSSKLGPASEGERAALIAASPLAGKYEAVIDRDSAHEMLARRAEEAALELQRAVEATRQQADKKAFAREFQSARRYEPPTRRSAAQTSHRAPPRSGESIPELVTKTLVRQIGTRSGQQLVRGILGSLFKGR